jgi:hypothetical protein
MLLTYREGQAADSVIDAGVDACRVLYEVGVNLGRLHQVPPAPHLRSFEHSGACNLGDHVAERWTPLFRASEHTAAHPFVPFYEARVKSLQVRGRPSGCARRLSIATSVLVNGQQGRAAPSVICLQPSHPPCAVHSGAVTKTTTYLAPLFSQTVVWLCRSWCE